MLRLIVFFTGMMVSAVGAADVVVEAGEHEDFSRIVLQLQNPTDWTFGKVSDGYELRLNTAENRFDFTRVFQKIPKSRIRSVDSPSGDRIFLRVSCDCHADAFEIRNGRIVLDIKDGAPSPGSTFENPLLGSEIEAAGVPQQRVPEIPLEPASVDESQFTTNNQQPTSGDYPKDQGLEFTPDLKDREKDKSSNRRVLTADAEGSDDLAPIAQHVPLSISVDDQLLPLFGFETKSDEPLSTINSSRLDVMQEALLKQLGRASSQGLIVMAPDFQPPVSAPDQETNATVNSAPVDDMPPSSEEKSSQHIRIETALDRAATKTDADTITTFQGKECLPDTYFDVSSWGQKDTGAGLSPAIDTSILGEFDAPLRDEVLKAVRHYIYLGFGAEAKSLLRTFGMDLDRSDILWLLAEIIDDPNTDRAGPLQNQISCKSMAALWAVLATPRLQQEDPANTTAVLQNFSGLPNHLRQHLGPTLASRFLKAGDPATAMAIRNMVTRSSQIEETAASLLQAQIDAELGKADASLEQLQKIVADGGQDSAEALIELINAKFDKEQVVDLATSQLAEAFAYENRGTDIGRRLTAASIRGMIASSQIEKAFEAIESARKASVLIPSDATELLAVNHIRNADESTNVDFLRLLKIYGNPAGDHTPRVQEARRAVASRLLDLGFNEDARTLLLSQSEESPPTVEDRLQLVNSYLADRKPELALPYLTGLSDAKASVLRAKTLEMIGESSKAAALYQEQNMSSDAARAAWVSGDWRSVALFGDDIQKSAAKLFEPNGTIDDSASGNMQTDLASVDNALPDEGNDATKSLQYGRAMVERSALSRAAIEALLKN